MTAQQHPRSSMLTDIGRRRDVNEDWCSALEPNEATAGRDGYLWIVADGVGAFGHGDEASRLGGEAALLAYRSGTALPPGDRLREALQAGNRAVWQRRRELVREGKPMPIMTTMLAAALIGDDLLLGNVGDCRAYLARGGQIRQLTHDHTWVAEQVAKGALRPEEARHHPRSNVITRALGQRDSVEADLSRLKARPGDRLLLCSDGLTRHLEDQELLQILVESEPEQAAAQLVSLANSRGGEDNITAVVVEVPAISAPVSAPRADSVEAVQHKPLPGPAPAASPPAADALAISSEAPGSPRPEPQFHPVATSTDAQTLATINRQRLALLLSIGQRISQSLDLDETLSAVMQSVVEVTHGERGFIMLLDPETQELTLSIGHNFGGQAGGRPPEYSRNIVRSVYSSGEPLLIGDALADPHYNQFESVVIRSLRSVLCVPLTAKGQHIGVVYVENRLGAEVFTEADLELLRLFAAQAAIALENARLHEQVKARIAENVQMRTNQENVLGSIRTAIVSLDNERRVLLFNRKAEEILGVRAEAAVGRPLDELLPATLRATLASLTAPHDGADEHAVDEVRLETRLPHRGRTVLAVKALPLRDAEQRQAGTVLLVEDVTHERLLDEARQREQTEKERIKAVFGRFMAPAVVEQLMEDPQSVQLGGTQRELTVLFADIRGFTGISERNSPEEVVKILNSYLTCATEVIFRNGGTLDKFLGDGVMAFFNAPLLMENHALAAVRSALEMQTRLSQLTGPGGARIAFGVGINCGEGIVGNIGAADLMNYTVIGDVTNVAARLQAEARAGEVLISASVYEKVAQAVEVEELYPVTVKGRAQPVPLFKVVSLFD